MALPTVFDPFAEMQALQRQLFGDDWLTPVAKTVQMPTTDIYTEGDKQMVIEAHLPSFQESDIDVRVEKGILEIQAERHEEKKEAAETKKYIVRETSSSFYRRIRLPEIADDDNIEAHMEQGILRVIVPFRELPAPKKISVKKK